MARTFTAGERTNIGATAKKIYSRFSIMDSEGNWDDMSSLGSQDWFLGASVEKGLEDNCWRMTARFRLDNGSTASLAPLREDSTINVDSGAAYAPQVDAHRQWKVEVAVIEATDTLQSSDWKELCAGLYQRVVITDSPRVLTIYGLDYGASLALAYIDEERTYGNDDTPVAMETVIQQVLTDNGLSGITLYTPTSPSFVMKAFTLKDISVMEAVNLIAAKAAMKVYYEYDASDVFRLTLTKPNREAEPGDEVWTLGPGEYYELPSASLDGDQVRNEIIGRYWDDTAEEVLPITRQDTASITRYGGPHAVPYRMALDLSQDTNLTTAARVTTLLDAILSDVSTPPFEHEYVTPGFWIAQLGDYGKFTANGVHYSTDQYGGVNWIRHDIENGTIRTRLKVGGQPAGRYRTWLADPRLIRGAPELRITDFRETTRSDSTVTYGWDAEGVVNEFWLWLTTTAQPIAADPWPALNTEPTVRLTSATRSYEVTLPDFGYVVVGQLVSVDTNGRVGRPWQFTLQSQSAPRLVQRATVTGTTGTTVTVRVAVADPQPSGIITIAHVATGCTVDKASPQQIAAGSVTTDIDTTGYVDYVVTRPSAGAGTGRVTFTASSTNRQIDIDAIDVPEQQDTLLYTACTASITDSDATTVTVTVTATASVGTPTVGLVSVTGATINSGHAAGTFTYAQNGTDNVWVFDRAAFQSGGGQAVFKSVLTGYVDDTDSVEIDEQGRDTIPLLCRARVTASDNDEVTVRVAVADPYPQGAGSATITYQNQGTGGVTPASGGTVTPASTLTEAAGTYVDYTITRPAFGAGTGRVTFTATASGRTSDSDAVEVPAQERDTVELLCRAKVQSTSATQVVARVAVADYVSGGSGDVTLTYTATGCTIASPASPQTIVSANVTADIDTTGTVDVTINRAAFEAGMGRVTFTATRTGRVPSTDSLDVQSQDGPGPVMDVVGAPGTTEFTITYTATGTLTYSVDGGAYGAVPASPFTVSRNAAGGADKVLTFKCVRNSQTVTSMITVPPQVGTSASPPQVYNVRVTGVNNTTEVITVAWDSANVGSFTFALNWSLGGAYFGANAITTITGVTSPYSHDDTGAGGHGLDLTSGGTVENIYYQVEIRDGTTMMAASEPYAYQVDHV